MYCLRCREHTTTLNETDTTFKNGRPVKKGVCAVCAAKKFQILPGVSRTGGGSLVNSALSALPMLEMHMRLPKGVLSEDVPGGSFQNTGRYSYCGPFTKLNKRLSEGYLGVNQLDRACFDHDVSYAAHEDTTSRDHADDVLAAAATKIALSDDASKYEKNDARTVAAIMSSKSRLGMGVGRYKRSVPTVAY